MVPFVLQSTLTFVSLMQPQCHNNPAALFLRLHSRPHVAWCKLCKFDLRCNCKEAVQAQHLGIHSHLLITGAHNMSWACLTLYTICPPRPDLAMVVLIWIESSWRLDMQKIARVQGLQLVCRYTGCWTYSVFFGRLWNKKKCYQESLFNMLNWQGWRNCSAGALLRGNAWSVVCELPWKIVIADLCYEVWCAFQLSEHWLCQLYL